MTPGCRIGSDSDRQLPSPQPAIQPTLSGRLDSTEAPTVICEICGYLLKSAVSFRLGGRSPAGTGVFDGPSLGLDLRDTGSVLELEDLIAQ